MLLFKEWTPTNCVLPSEDTLKDAWRMPGHAGTLWVLTCLRVATGERKHLACNAKVEAIEEKATFAIL